MSGAAYQTQSPVVLQEWSEYQAYVSDMESKRQALSDRFGRRLMVNRSGFGHGTRVVGFEQLDSDTDGDVLGENGELRVPKVGPPYRTVVPNIRRKAGKVLRDELGDLTLNGPKFTGMPTFTFVGLSACAPALFRHEDTVWAYWPEGVDLIDIEVWEQVPLSTYHAAHEAYEAAEKAEAAS